MLISDQQRDADERGGARREAETAHADAGPRDGERDGQRQGRIRDSLFHSFLGPKSERRDRPRSATSIKK